MIKLIPQEAMMTALQQTVQQEIGTLPDELLMEVLDFIHFLRNKSDEEAFLWYQVEKTYQYRRQHPNSVITATADEFLADTSELDSD